jgi:hypothetical protein
MNETYARLARDSRTPPVDGPSRISSSLNVSWTSTARHSPVSRSRQPVSERWAPALDDYIELAAYLLDVEPSAVRALPRITLAESAVHAPLPSAPRRQQTRCISSHGPVSRCERPDLGIARRGAGRIDGGADCSWSSGARRNRRLDRQTDLPRPLTVVGVKARSRSADENAAYPRSKGVRPRAGSAISLPSSLQEAVFG